MLLFALLLSLAQDAGCEDPAACAPAIGYEESQDAPLFEQEVLPLLERAVAASSGSGDDGGSADLYQSLGETRRGELRCATLALFATEALKGQDLSRSLGVTSEGAGVLAGRFAEAMADETGKNSDEILGLFSADLYALAEQVRPAADPEAAVAEALGKCRPLYDTIVLNDGPDGYVTGLMQPVILVDPALPNPVACYALLSAFASQPMLKSDDRKMFERAADQVRKAWLADPAAGDSASEELATAAANFDGPAFSALPEEKAEDRILFCLRLGGIQ